MSKILVHKLQEKIDEIESAPIFQQAVLAKGALKMAIAIIVDHSNRLEQLERKRAHEN